MQLCRILKRLEFTLIQGYFDLRLPGAIFFELFSKIYKLNVKGQSLGLKKKNDAPLPYQLTFQDPATSGMEGIIDLHHEIMFYVVIIITFVL